MIVPAELRSPEVVLGRSRLGAAVPNALAFSRAAMREAVRGRWTIEKLRFELDADGRGEILYRLLGGGWVFHFFLVSQKLPEEVKTDRNFAQSWDAMGVLCQGEWTPEREARLRVEVPKQRAGFADYDTLVYARGNRSARLFDHVVDSLAAGRQPDPQVLAPVGYILRTTAFIGNGQLGTRAFAGFEPGHPLRRPYHAQFCSAFMLREYVFDLVDHMARARNPGAARLAPAFRRYLGLGNAAATGLAAFVANHPQLMHRWCSAHEVALAEARRREVRPGDLVVGRFLGLLEEAIRHFEQSARPEDGVYAPPQRIATELWRLHPHALQYLESGTLGGTPTRQPWAALCRHAREQLHPEAAEVVDAIVLELYPDIVDGARDAFLADERFDLRPASTVADLMATLEAGYSWALEPKHRQDPHYFWYRASQTPRDVRRGLRGREPAFEFETTLDTVLKVRELCQFLRDSPRAMPVADLVHARPDLRHIVARVQSLEGQAYAELREDWLARDFSPFGPVRFALSFYGMEKFEAALPKSVRGTFMQGAPIAEDVAHGRDGDWPFPLMPTPGDDGTRLAPLPTSNRGAAPRAPVPAPADGPMRFAPAELARMVQTALQGHGAALGVAEEAARLVLLAQCDGRPAVRAVLAHCAEGRMHMAQPPGLPPPGPTARLDGQAASSLLHAPAALDFATARASLAPGRLGAVLVEGVAAASLAGGLARRCAERGLFGLVVWSDAAARPCCGFELAGPGRRGPWTIGGALPQPAALLDHARALGVDAAVAPITSARQHARDGAPIAPLVAAISRAVAAAPEAAADRARADGFLLLGLRLPPAAQDDALPGALRTELPQARVLDAQALRAADEHALRHGVPVTRAEVDALNAAGAALLVPQAEEHRVLPEGADPLKVF